MTRLAGKSALLAAPEAEEILARTCNADGGPWMS